MKFKVKTLPLTVGITSLLIIIAAQLMVLGIFDEWLDWDIFSPKVEIFLKALFASCVALAVFGFGLTIVLGTQEIVKAISSIRQISNKAISSSPSSKKHYFLVTKLFT